MLRAIFTALSFLVLIPQTSFGEQVIVKDGETLSEIAYKHNISIKKIQQMNGINNPNQLFAGTKLRIPDSAYSKSKNLESIHTVKAGETLSGIARKYGLTEKKIMDLNKINTANYLYLGQKIKLPSKKILITKEATNFHNVTRGDTLNSISFKYQISQHKLKEINNLTNADYLYLGQRIKLNEPIQEEKVLPRNSNSYHTVSEGETLSNISKRYNVPIKDLIKINNLEDPNRLFSGKRIALFNDSSSQSYVNENISKGSSTNSIWRQYGPLKVDWTNWQSMNGSHVAPTLHKDGKALYLAVNCSFQKLNATGSNGNWKNWISPQEDFEHKLVNDLCN